MTGHSGQILTVRSGLRADIWGFYPCSEEAEGVAIGIANAEALYFAHGTRIIGIYSRFMI
jgi:hypothetical protein